MKISIWHDWKWYGDDWCFTLFQVDYFKRTICIMVFNFEIDFDWRNKE